MDNERSTQTKRLVALFAAAALIAAACSGGGDSSPTTTVPGALTTPATVPGSGKSPTSTSNAGGANGLSGGLGVRLSEGSAVSSGNPELSVATGTPLTAAEIAAVLDRLPAWDVPADDVADFNRPVGSLKPPAIGDTVDVPFPPAPDAPTAPDAAPDGPLTVLRVQPEGDVDLAPFIALTFDQPMVPLGTLDQLDEIDVPVTIEPDIAKTAGIDGRWRWIGTRTLRFEVTPEPGAADDDASAAGNAALDRLPAATDYTVTVPAGTESVNGATLTDAVSFTFSTPAPAATLISGLADSMGLDPVFVASFNQRVDPAVAIDAITFTAGNVTAVRLATEAEVDADLGARSSLDRALPGRAVAFVPTETLPTDTAVSVQVGPGLASLEGPRAGTDTLTESGRTYAPLKIQRSECSDRCAPLTPFSISFNNPLDRDAFDATWITVEPGVPGLRVEVYGNSLQIRGATAGNTTYKVTISPDIIDVYGQTLGQQWEKNFNVGDARPIFVGPDRQFVTTDPFADAPGLSYTTINHDALSVTAWKVSPEQYGEFITYVESTYSETRPADPRWPVALDTKVETNGASDQLTETFVDLSAAIADSGGPVVVRVEPDPPVASRSDDYWLNQPSYVWVQNSEIGIDAFAVDEELIVWVTDLTTGKPVEGATVTAIGSDARSTTAADGVTRIKLGAAGVTALTATSGDRTTMLPSQRFNGWEASPRSDGSSWYVIDDRGIYRPGETVSITGLVRRVTADDAQLERFGLGSFVSYQAFDPLGNPIANASVPVNSVGGFDLRIDVPEASNTGTGYVQLWLTNSAEQTESAISSSHAFQIQDFRTPDFEVTARAESEGPYYVVEPATIAADASYFAGGPLGDSEVNWTVSTSDTTYAPPNWRDFSFGVWTPWWYDFGYGFGGDDDGYYGGDFSDGYPGNDLRYQTYTGRTDAGGTHRLQLDFADIPASSDPDAEPTQVDQPTSVTAEVTVFDVNRQAIASRTNLLVHPARFYVGVRSDRGFVEKGQPIVIDTTVVDVDGNAIAGREFNVVAGRVDYTYADGSYIEELVDEQTCTVTSTDAVANDAVDESMRCEFDTEVGGQYKVTAIVTDDDGRSNRAEYTQYVSGGTARPTRDLTQGDVVMVPDAEFHAPGDTAELLVQAPFAPASGLLTVTRAGLETVEAFDAPDGSAILSVPISDDDIPNLNVRVDMVGVNERLNDDGSPATGAPPQPAFAVGEVRLQIPPASRTLAVAVSPASSDLLPGDSTSVDVSVLDAAGDPVADAGVALIVVDEAVLSLSGYELADPLDAFYSGVFAGLDPTLIRDSIVLANPDVFNSDLSVAEAAAEAPADTTGGAVADEADSAVPTASDGRSSGAAQGTDSTPIDVRVDFNALAVFAPDETTDASGKVTVQVDLPDSLTRYRVMAVGVSGDDRFGSGESTITARLPISVRPSAPRFLNFGDVFELPVVMQNQSDQDVQVDLAIEVANLTLTGESAAIGASAGRRVTVPANDRVEVRFPASAAEVGTARFRVAAVGGAFADAATIDLPVYTPATSEAFATYGVLDGDAAIAQPLLAPSGVFPQFGGLEISTSSTALQALTDAVLYLYDYRYNSADGYGSRIMAVAALRDVLDAFDADGLPAPDELNARVNSDIEHLQALQNDDGGFPSWQRGRESIPWVSVYSTHAQVLAQQNGYDVDQPTMDRSLEHISRIEDFIPAFYGKKSRDAISAYALYVRGLVGTGDSAKALALYRSGTSADTLQLDSIAQLWTVIDDEATRSEIQKLIENSVVETPGAATFATSYGEDDYMIAHSDRRTDGIILDALVREDPSSDVIPKVVTGLLGNQTRGRWNNAYENSFILLALNEYFDAFESVDPDFVARAWLGETYAVESEFRGRSTVTNLTTVPMATLIESGDVNLVLDKDGEGRLYYRLGLRYAPDDLDLDARDEGFVVERTYEAIDDPSDVTRRADGTWEITAGASVRVRLTMIADARRTHVALIDPLPAGLEAVNPALATAPQTAPGDDAGPVRSSYWWWQWFEYQNLRDDRAEAFTSYLSGGTYDYSYLARATTPGEFVVPPTRAEEIYSPEVFGRSSSDKVIVVDR